MSRIRKGSRYIPTLEAMESRLVPAGNVSAYIRGDILYLYGDNAANQISVVSDGSAGVSITSLDDTTINRQTGDEDGTVFLSGRRAIRAIRTDLRGGDDILNLSGFTLRNDLDIRMGAGHDILAIDSVFTQRGRSVITTSTGNDFVDITGSSFEQRLDLLTGSGNDRVNLIDSHFGRRSVIDGGSGGDTLGYVNNTWGERAKVEGFDLTTPNPLPTAFNDSATVASAGEVVIDLALNDTAATGTLDLNSIVITTDPLHGTVQVNGDGTVTYLHDGSASTSDSFRYTISTEDGVVSNIGTVFITVSDEVDESPVAVNDTANLTLGGTALINVAQNDSATVGSLDLSSIVVTQQPTRGTLTVNADGTIQYVNNGTFATSDSFRYTINDDQGNTSNEAIVTINLSGDVNAPVALNDVGTVTPGGSLSLSVLNNDTDLQNNINPTSVAIVQQPVNGTATLNGDGTITYLHNGGSTLSDSFTYTVTDFTGLTSNVATVNLTVSGTGSGAPVAVNDTGAVNFGASVILNLLGNDSDPQNNINPNTVTITQQPLHGTVTLNGNGTVTYTHNNTSTATTDTFFYTVSDFTGLTSNLGMVSLTINMGI